MFESLLPTLMGGGGGAGGLLGGGGGSSASSSSGPITVNAANRGQTWALIGLVTVLALGLFWSLRKK